MTRLTNAFSKKAENHAHIMAIYFMHYNFVRIHQTLRVTPAMAAGVTGKLWEMSLCQHGRVVGFASGGMQELRVRSWRSG
jgi:hypothetical protein